jgi:serine protease Do
MKHVLTVVAAAVMLSGTVYGQDVLQLRGQGSQIGVVIAESDAAVTISEVRPGTPAERGGVKAGDVVVSFDGEAIRSARQFTRVVDETRPNKAVSVVVTRDGKRQTLSVTPEPARFGNTYFGPALRNLEQRLPQINGNVRRDGNILEFLRPGARAFAAPRRLGIELAPLSGQLAEYFGVTSGALVSSVNADSAAARAGIRAGDVITAVDGQAVDQPSDVTSRVSRAGQGSSLELRVMRDKKDLTLKATLAD